MIKGFVFFLAGTLSFITYLLPPSQLSAEQIFLMILSFVVMLIGLDLALANFYLGKPRESIKPGEYSIVSITDVSKDGQMYCYMILKNLKNKNKEEHFYFQEDYFYSIPKNMINHHAQFKPDRLRITQQAGLTTATLL